MDRIFQIPDSLEFIFDEFPSNPVYENQLFEIFYTSRIHHLSDKQRVYCNIQLCRIYKHHVYEALKYSCSSGYTFSAPFELMLSPVIESDTVLTYILELHIPEYTQYANDISLNPNSVKIELPLKANANEIQDSVIINNNTYYDILSVEIPDNNYKIDSLWFSYQSGIILYNVDTIINTIKYPPLVITRGTS